VCGWVCGCEGVCWEVLLCVCVCMRVCYTNIPKPSVTASWFSSTCFTGSALAVASTNANVNTIRIAIIFTQVRGSARDMFDISLTYANLRSY